MNEINSVWNTDLIMSVILNDHGTYQELFSSNVKVFAIYEVSIIINNGY